MAPHGAGGGDFEGADAAGGGRVFGDCCASVDAKDGAVAVNEGHVAGDELIEGAGVDAGGEGAVEDVAL